TSRDTPRLGGRLGGEESAPSPGFAGYSPDFAGERETPQSQTTPAAVAARLASIVIKAVSPLLTAPRGNTALPSPTAVTPRARYSSIGSSSTPPETQSGVPGIGPCSQRT